MKKLILLIFTAVVLFASANAQNYRLDKNEYDYRDWTYEAHDRYNPSVCGVTSFVLPGLGQMIANEPGRGVAFLGAAMGSMVIYSIGAVQATTALDVNSGIYDGEGVGLMAVGLVSLIVVDIWSIVDAVHVAKVKNLAWRDKTDFRGIRLEPYIAPIKSYNSTGTQAGLCLKLSF